MYFAKSSLLVLAAIAVGGSARLETSERELARKKGGNKGGNGSGNGSGNDGTCNTSKDPLSCPEGEEREYFLSEAGTGGAGTWAFHNNYAKSIGCQLPSIRNTYENDAVFKAFKFATDVEYVWLNGGLKPYGLDTSYSPDSERDGRSWEWLDGRPFKDIGQWEATAPDGPTGVKAKDPYAENRLYMDFNGEWGDDPESETLFAVYDCGCKPVCSSPPVKKNKKDKNYL